MKNLSIYKLTSKALKGSIYLAYHNGFFQNLAVETKDPLQPAQHTYLLQRIPHTVEDINVLKTPTSDVVELAAKSVKDKCILFCQAYYFYRKVSYVCTTLERANVKNVPVNQALLDTFFHSNLENFTLTNYIKRINITKDQAKNGNKGMRFPNDWNADYARKLDQAGTTLMLHI